MASSSDLETDTWPDTDATNPARSSITSKMSASHQKTRSAEAAFYSSNPLVFREDESRYPRGDFSGVSVRPIGEFRIPALGALHGPVIAPWQCRL